MLAQLSTKSANFSWKFVTRILTFAITETWIKQDDVDTVTKEVPPQGYKILSRSRSGGKTGDGVALVYRDHYFVKELDQIEVTTMEYQGYQLRFDHIILNLYVIYHLPSGSVPQFCNEFASILESDVSEPADKALYHGDITMTPLHLWTI